MFRVSFFLGKQLGTFLDVTSHERIEFLVFKFMTELLADSLID